MTYIHCHRITQNYLKAHFINFGLQKNAFSKMWENMPNLQALRGGGFRMEEFRIQNLGVLRG